MSTDLRRRQVVGRGLPLHGNDIDTDRIIPARFLKAVTFAGLGEHAFEDARKVDPEHPFNQKAYQGASIMVVGANFGCGSSREHAPQALLDWGIHALVGVSFGEIFFGNCTTNGMPCLHAAPADIEWLQREVGRRPAEPLTRGRRAPGGSLRGADDQGHHSRRLPQHPRRRLLEHHGRAPGGGQRHRGHRPAAALRQGLLRAVSGPREPETPSE